MLFRRRRQRKLRGQRDIDHVRKAPGPPAVRGTVPLAQRTVEVVSSADQRQMGEGPRKVSLLLSGSADLLGVQADMIAIGKHLVESDLCFIEPPERESRPRHTRTITP